jgi:ABC-type uncharacterized transport system ATPase subunit
MLSRDEGEFSGRESLLTPRPATWAILRGARLYPKYTLIDQLMYFAELRA